MSRSRMLDGAWAQVEQVMPAPRRRYSPQGDPPAQGSSGPIDLSCRVETPVVGGTEQFQPGTSTVGVLCHRRRWARGVRLSINCCTRQFGVRITARSLFPRSGVGRVTCALSVPVGRRQHRPSRA